MNENEKHITLIKADHDAEAEWAKMTEKQITFTKAELDAMSDEQLTNLLLKVSKVTATAVVRRADGSIKYDRPELAGQYGEEHLREGGERG